MPAENISSTLNVNDSARAGAITEKQILNLFEELEPLAGLRTAKSRQQLLLERDSRLKSTRNQLAARGLADSGSWVAEFLSIHIGFLEQFCRTILDTWTELISKRGQPLSDEVVAFIMEKIDAVLTNQPRRIIDSERTNSDGED